eukprot:CAMPEP_0167740040 /NCGR_PEP_ID=MMETSP0110_2-20121227/55_1 /TAXON_ID=629695 /ORGANISM="Gymnochlora sp., Strain CCMP2014" /LENGTH=173 /DNA_ID=CAMNT_0007623887 /DNA_START=1129 /DNA_END=1650 /DNA_ORIENTATION=-
MPEMTFDIMNYEEKNYKCSIPSVSVERIKGKNVAVFRVEMTLDGKTQVLRKRYRDFYSFDTYLRGAFDGHHLLSNLPKVPPKQIPLFTDHFAPKFLEERRIALQAYVRKLLLIPKVVNNPDFQRFFSKQKRKDTRNHNADSKSNKFQDGEGEVEIEEEPSLMAVPLMPEVKAL